MSRRRRRQMAEMNVVPYIDVMLVLLVIFMVTAPMMQTGVEINMPEADTETLGASHEVEPVSITVNEQGEFYIGEDQIEGSAELAQIISDQLANKPNRPVHIRGDQNATYDYIMKAMVAAQQAGATNIGLLTSVEAVSANEASQ